ncbi:SGNH/GDSL hydrolase family protein, partial [Micromonospora zamorensis]
TQVRGRDRGPAGRWAQLRRRAFFGVGAVPHGSASDTSTVEGLA